MYTNAHGKPDTNNENIPITLNFLFFSSDAVHGAGQIMCFLLCVCVSVTFVHSVNTNKDIFTFFLYHRTHTILVFLYQTAWQYSDGNRPNGGVECRWGRQKSRFSSRCNTFSCDRRVCQQYQYLERSLLLLVTMASDLSLHTIKLCSMFSIVSLCVYTAFVFFSVFFLRVRLLRVFNKETV